MEKVELLGLCIECDNEYCSCKHCVKKSCNGDFDRCGFFMKEKTLEGSRVGQ